MIAQAILFLLAIRGEMRSIEIIREVYDNDERKVRAYGSSLQARLCGLAKSGRIVRVRTGVYKLAEQA